MADARTLTIAVFHEPSGWSLEDRYVDRLRDAAGEGVEVRRATGSVQFSEMLGETTHLLGLPASEDQMLGAAPPRGGLQWVQLTQSVGDASPAVAAAMRSGVQVCSSATVRAPAIAEHGVTLLGALARRLGDAMGAQAEHRWASAELARSARLISDMRVGVVAFGPVAASMVALLRAYGATVVCADPTDARPFIGPDASADLDAERMPITELVAACDALIVACPRIPSNTGAIAKHELARIKRGAMIVDLAGGGVISEPALLDALRRDRVSAAALDAFEREPLAVGSPWWTMPNVVVTPRLSGAGHGYWDRSIDWFAENIRRVFHGEECIDRLPDAWVEDAALARR